MPFVGKTVATVTLDPDKTTVIEFTDGTVAALDGSSIKMNYPTPKIETSATYTNTFCCPDHTSGGDHWRVNNTCSYCGSWHPDLFMEALENQTIELIPTDKGYKVGITGRDKKIDAIKFYWYHLSDAQQHRFIELHNEKGKLLIAFPGHFYTTPFFCKPRLGE